MAKAPAAVKERMTKTQMLNAISEETGVSRKEVGAVLDSLAGVIDRHVSKRGVGEFVLLLLMWWYIFVRQLKSGSSLILTPRAPFFAFYCYLFDYLLTSIFHPYLVTL
jgi:hypothetical protein